MDEELKIKTERAYSYAIYLLSLKLRTEGELREKMRVKKFEQKVVNEVIEQLYKNKYIDDQRYAEVYLENLKKYKNFGFFGIKKKLMERKLSAETIEKVLRENLNIEEEIKIAKRFLKKSNELRVMNYELSDSDAVSELEENTYSFAKYNGQKDPQEVKKQKTLAKLKSRGFRSEVISKFF